MDQRKGATQSSSAVLVTGGSGYLGAHLVRHLADAGETVVSMYRNRLPEPCSNVFPVCSDLSSEELLAAPLRGVDTVVHLAWENSFTGPEADLSDDPRNAKNQTKNIRLLKNMIEAMERARTRRLIFVSAFGASKNTREPFLAEKYTAEFYILNSRIPEKVVLRPTVIYGGEETHNRFIGAIRRIIRFPGFYPVPSWKERIYPLSLTDFKNIVTGLLRLEVSGEPVRIIHLSGQEGYRVEEIFRIVAGTDGRGARIPVGSVLGQTLLPLFEKGFKSAADQVGIRQFLSVSGLAKNDASDQQELDRVFKGPYQKFVEVMGKPV